MDKFTIPSQDPKPSRSNFPLDSDINPDSNPQSPSIVPPGPMVPNTEDLQKYFRSSVSKADFSTDFHRGSRSGGVGYKLVAWSFVAALIDALIIFSLSCLFLLSFSFLVKSQAHQMLQILGGSVYKVGFLGGAMLLGSYMIMLRVFLGFTIGEWACGLRLGNLKQRLNRFYSLRVVARMFLICITGLVVIPFFSLITGRDIAGLLIRLPLVHLKGS